MSEEQKEADSVRQLARYGEEKLRAAGVPDAAYDARQLLFVAAGIDETQFLTRPDKQLDKQQKELYVSYLKRRVKRIPLQLILGHAYFYGRAFFVDGKELIPRPDTEILVEEALKDLHPGDSLLDICTGSGCIVLTLACEIALKEAVGTDISEAALAAAERNLEHLSQEQEIKTKQVRLLKGDLGEPVLGKRFDMLVANPPYIRTKQLAGLQPEVRRFDPVLALDGGADGLVFYRKIARQAAELLRPGGKLLFEIGYDQAEEVKEILSAAGFSDLTVVKDYGGNDRVIRGVYGRFGTTEQHQPAL